jgi:hypothetical protein
MKALGYVFLIFLVIGCWIIWQIIRRASAGAQAILSPERYAMQKVERMKEGAIFGNPLTGDKSDPADNKSYPAEKWDALVKYDPEISAAADKLRPHGGTWIDKLGGAYFALQEERKYLPNILRKLLDEAEAEEVHEKARAEHESAQRWAKSFSQTADGALCTENFPKHSSGGRKARIRSHC